MPDQELKEYFAKTYDTPEAIAELAEILSQVDSVEHLQDLNECEFYDRSRYNRAVKLLPKDKQFQLRAIAIELSDIEGKHRPTSYLERWQSQVGKTVQCILDNAEVVVSTIGKFIGLEIVNNNCLARVISNGIMNYYEPSQLEFISN